MSNSANNKAALKALMRGAASKKEKRIESPIVRYNESGQAVCKVCNSVVKSESLWPAHLASKSHKENVENLKAKARGIAAAPVGKKVADDAARAAATAARGLGTAAALSRVTADASGAQERSSVEHIGQQEQQLKASMDLKASTGGSLGIRKADALPNNFFDAPQPKVMRSDSSSAVEEASTRGLKGSLPPGFFDSSPAQQVDVPQPPLAAQQAAVPAVSKLPPNFFDSPNDADALSTAASAAAPAPTTAAAPITGSGRSAEKELPKGVLPEGFFDNKEADQKARGVKVKKPDILDELKQFEASIKEEMAEVELRQADEEGEAADEREEREALEQRLLRERVERYRLLKQEKLKKAAEVIRERSHQPTEDEEEEESEGSDDGDDDEDSFLDWRSRKL